MEHLIGGVEEPQPPAAFMFGQHHPVARQQQQQHPLPRQPVPRRKLKVPVAQVAVKGGGGHDHAPLAGEFWQQPKQPQPTVGQNAAPFLFGSAAPVPRIDRAAAAVNTNGKAPVTKTAPLFDPASYIDGFHFGRAGDARVTVMRSPEKVPSTTASSSKDGTGYKGGGASSGAFQFGSSAAPTPSCSISPSAKDTINTYIHHNSTHAVANDHHQFDWLPSAAVAATVGNGRGDEKLFFFGTNSDFTPDNSGGGAERAPAVFDAPASTAAPTSPLFGNAFSSGNTGNWSKSKESPGKVADVVGDGGSTATKNCGVSPSPPGTSQFQFGVAAQTQQLGASFSTADGAHYIHHSAPVSSYTASANRSTGGTRQFDWLPGAAVAASARNDNLFFFGTNNSLKTEHPLGPPTGTPPPPPPRSAPAEDTYYNAKVCADGLGNNNAKVASQDDRGLGGKQGGASGAFQFGISTAAEPTTPLMFDASVPPANPARNSANKGGQSPHHHHQFDWTPTSAVAAAGNLFSFGTICFSLVLTMV